MKHAHESFEDCTVCNTEAALCKFCGRDIRIGGGSYSKKDGSICNSCRYDKSK